MLDQSLLDKPVLDEALPGSPSPTAALWFMYVSTFRNRLRAQAARARSPRYVIAVILGMLYLWWALFRNARLGNGPFATMVGTNVYVPIFATFLLGSAARWWIFGAERGTLAFAPAEVQFLFPAPFRRSTLLQ